MFRNLAAAAWRSASRDRLHVALNVAGLSLGFAAAVLIGLFVRSELGMGRVLPDYADIYRLQNTVFEPGEAPLVGDSTPHDMAAQLRLDFPEMAASTRFTGQHFGLRHGNVEANESGEAADPNFFAVLDYPLLRGDPATALAQPDSVVLSKALALKYFGTIDCVGQTMEIDRQHPVRVTGVLKELDDTNARFNVLLSGTSSYSYLTRDDAEPPALPGDMQNDVNTYIRLRAGTDAAALRDRLDQFVTMHYPNNAAGEAETDFRLWLLPLAALHLRPSNPDGQEPATAVITLWAVGITGVLILLVAGINFVNLVTARSTRRAVEVGVRKALGATRGQLVTQFMGESIAYALLALILAVAAVELILPGFNLFLDRSITFAYWRDPALGLTMLGAAILVGILAGLYPALVQSGFRPAASLKSRGAGTPGSGRLRQALVVLQFAVSIGLLIATAVIFRQAEFAASDSLRFDRDQVVVVELDAIRKTVAIADPVLIDTLKTRFAAVPGVRAVTGSWIVPGESRQSDNDIRRTDRPERLTIDTDPVDFGFFELYGMKPLAGRLFARSHGDDRLSVPPEPGEGTAIINAAAVGAMGYASPEAAIGGRFSFLESGSKQTREIVGVVPDMQMHTARQMVRPAVFLAIPSWDLVLSLKLDGQHVPETLAGIDRAWHEVVPSRPIDRRFLDDRIEELYRDMRREGAIFGSFALVAVAIGCCGLFGLSAFTAERRTKEIGIRKALGASTLDMVRLLIWQFVRPVLLANAIAWPIAWLVMGRWLDGFAYRVTLDPAIFLMAGLAAFAIATGTTAFHALQVSRARPATALRYE